MIIDLTNDVKVIQVEDGAPCIITRPCIMGGVATHIISSPYNANEIATWLANRLMRWPNLLAQDAFPHMESDDREFLMSGITPTQWNKMFPKEEEE